MVYLFCLITGFLSCVCWLCKIQFPKASEFFVLLTMLMFSVFCGILSHLINYTAPVDPVPVDPEPAVTIDYCIDIGALYSYTSPLDMVAGN